MAATVDSEAREAVNGATMEVKAGGTERTTGDRGGGFGGGKMRGGRRGGGHGMGGHSRP